MSANKKINFLSEEFCREIIERNIGFVEEHTLGGFLSLLEIEFKSTHCSARVEKNMLRILNSLFDRTSLIRNAAKYPHYCKMLAAVASCSNYLSDVIVREPHLLNWLLHSDALNKNISAKDFYVELTSSLSHVSSYDSKVRTLKAIKRREILRIGAKDILGISNLKSVTKELSVVAKSISKILFDISLQYILQRKNFPDRKISYALVALGKLGADELNYSSDIDLILFFDIKNKNNFEAVRNILTEALHLFIESASRSDDAGFLYRVDFRLRPDGKASPLSGGLIDYLHYYETRGEDWERQMLIKASFVAGSKKLFNKFHNYLQPFIFPKTFSRSPVEQINRLRKNYINKLGADDNIKLSYGGIRDIEFSVQALQLINGGENISLRKPDTLSALAALKKTKLISAQEYRSISKSYIFFRKIEHYLQLMNDRQTHKIPAEGELLCGLVSYCGFKSEKIFFDKLSAHKVEVTDFYKTVFNVSNAENSNSGEIDFDNFEDKIRAKKNWNYLKEGIGLLGRREFDNYTLASFMKISPMILQEIQKTEWRDLYLENFSRIIRSAKFPSIWYESLSDKNMFEAFSKLILGSQYAVELFAEDYTLRDHFLSGKVFSKINEEDFSTYSPKQIQFILAVQLTLGLIDYFDVSAVKQNYILKFLRKYFGENSCPQNSFVAGAGSFGSNELTFHSDIDLIFVSGDENNFERSQQEFVKHLTEIKKLLSPWNVDLRLRPEGKSSQLAWEPDAYKKYLQSRARVWELQSLLKIKFIAGREDVYNDLLGAIHNAILSLDKKFIRSEILSMRKKLLPGLIDKNVHLKKSNGGLTDIHFLADYLYLANPTRFEIKQELSMFARIDILFSRQNEINLQPLILNYKFMKELELLNQNLFAVSTSIFSLDEKKITRVAGLLNLSRNELAGKIESVMKEIYSMFNKILND